MAMPDRSCDRWLPAVALRQRRVPGLACSSPALAHTIDCSGRSGIELARCERHQKMAAQCGPIKGDAHFACDREFLLANPLQCDALGDDDGKRCAAESAAFKACEPQPGREFMRCVRRSHEGEPEP